MSSQFDRHHEQHHSHHHHHHSHHHNHSNHAATFLDREQMTFVQNHPPGNNQVRIFIQGNYRYIIANGIPNHAIGAFTNAIKQQNYYFRIPAKPHIAEQITELRRQPFGVAINGVVFDPEAAEFWNGERHSGWRYEALSGKMSFGLDTNNAHVRSNGAYHYHGLPVGLIPNLGNDQRMLLIGYAADGFPVYAEYGYSDPNNCDSKVRKMRSSYRLKQGQRPSGPGKQYDGTFVQDYEYVSGAGDLDECNGRFGVTPEYLKGIYHYYITEEFPFISRYLRGTPDTSFQRRGRDSKQGSASAPI